MTALTTELVAALVNGWLGGLTLLALAVALDRPSLLPARARHHSLLACVGGTALLALRAREWWMGGVVAAAGGSGVPFPETTIGGGSPVLRGLALSWLVVAACLLAREGVGHLRLRRLRRTWRPLAPAERAVLGGRGGERVRYLTGGRGAPLTLGIVRPAVYLPARAFRELSPEGLRAIAAHERAHARWYDPATWALARLVRIALWPVLPLWLLEHRLHRVTELAADAEATAGGGPGARCEYGRTLLAVARWRAPAAARGVPAVAGGRLEARLRSILGSPRPVRGATGIVAALAGLAVATLLAVPWAGPPSERFVPAGRLSPSQAAAVLDRFRREGWSVSQESDDRIRVVIKDDTAVRRTVRSLRRGDGRPRAPAPSPVP